MRHAAGELPDGLHLLRLPELRLERLPIADVGADAEQADRRPVLVASSGLAGDPARAAIGPQHAELDFVVGAVALRRRQRLLDQRRSSGWISAKSAATVVEN